MEKQQLIFPKAHNAKKFEMSFSFLNTVIRFQPALLAMKAIKGADYSIIGPNDLFTSIIPNLIVSGVKEVLQETSAKILSIMNIMSKFGKTHNFSGLDFIQKLEESIEQQIDGVIYNSEKPDKTSIERYMAQKTEFVEIGESD